ncbi:hypothetical protein [Kutzneria sp. CA-103260]|uniref:hypothetical protein n=1 Tax=Kutzneria sp. CA-103260 TaxID=2802641 RepID=UPI001BA9A70E|nr:hypothetical protein [Kutzneria sp. CA-103260]QUQ69493.1 hypothetical protein JJ691_72510 [Kutzneria sp. CA-103260]
MAEAATNDSEAGGPDEHPPEPSETRDPRPDEAPDRDELHGTDFEETKSDAVNSEARREPTDEREKVQQVNFNFHGPVDASSGHFGVVGVGGAPPKLIGKLSDTEVGAALRNYVPPRRYDDALSALATDHAVVLEGRRGSGKRAGAMSLLREVTDGPLVRLSPAAAVEELAQRVYEAGFGYLVIDRKDAGSAADTEFSWHAVRNRVRDSRAWLVVTTTDNCVDEGDSVVHVSWVQPELRELLTAWLGGEQPDRIAAIEQALAGEHTMTDLAAIGRRVAEDDDITTALKEFGLASRAQVRRWFDGEGDRTRRQLLEVTAMAFLGGCNERSFESLLARLEEMLADRVPVPSPPEEEAPPRADDVLPQRRHAMLAESGLLGVEQVMVHGVTGQVLDFRVGTYRRHVLAELWRRMDVTTFWDTVREWLHEIVGAGYSAVGLGHSESIAAGLAELARVAFDEVWTSYLKPWSEPTQSWAGATTAIYTLWSMCYDEDMAPVALRTAERWVYSGDSRKRWMATVAFSGALGSTYPIVATNRLWYLIRQSGQGDRTARWAMADLFALLAKSTEDAGIVLRVLETRWKTHGAVGGNTQLRTLAIATINEVVTAPGAGSGRSSLFRYVHAFPDKIPLAARLWAVVLCHRPCRRRVLECLLDGLYDLHRVSSQPQSVVRDLGAAFAEALPPDEHAPLIHDLAAVQARHIRRPAVGPAADRARVIDALVQILLSPLTSAILKREKADGTGVSDR